MKKNLIRGIALALVLILALGLIPMAAMAAMANSADKTPTFNPIGPGVSGGGAGNIIFVNDKSTVVTFYLNKYPILYDFGNDTIFGNAVDSYGNRTTYAPGSTVKASSYDNHALINGVLYDFNGFASYNEPYLRLSAFVKENPNATQDEVDKFVESLMAQSPTWTKSDIKIDPYPKKEDYANDDAYTRATEEWYNKYAMILAGYVPHTHKLSRWYSDGTTHWRECLVCRQYNPSHETMFMYQNWCQDGDEDQVCNVCGGHVPYHDITVIESEGGSITLNRDNASHRMKITADVKTNDGYQFVKLHFIKVRPDGSKQEVVRYGSGTSFWTDMPTYPMEVTAEFVKK